MPTTPFPPHPPIADLLASFQRGSGSTIELAQACLAHIDAHDAAVNALPTRVARQEVLEHAGMDPAVAGIVLRQGLIIDSLRGHLGASLHFARSIAETFDAMPQGRHYRA